VGRLKGRRLMTQAGVSGERHRRRGPKPPERRHGYELAPHLLARHCDVQAPNVAWCGDIPSIWTEAGWLDTSVLLALSSRQGVGWAMREHGEAHWVTEARELARGRRQPEAGLMHQSARGAQDARHASRGLLADHGIVGSMRGKGDGLDKAVAERFVGSVQRERTAKRYYRTRHEARADILEYLEMCYNSWRKHASRGYGSPNAYEKIARVA
jgi:putative transposase